MVRLTISDNPGPLSSSFGDYIHSFAGDPAYNFTVRGSRLRLYLTAGLGPSWFVPAQKGRDFQFEVAVSDPADPSRVVRIGPKTLSIQDYVQTTITGVTASPSVINIASDSSAGPTVIIGGRRRRFTVRRNLTYKWTVSEGTCGNLDFSQLPISNAGTDQISAPDPALCGTSNLPPEVERAAAV